MLWRNHLFVTFMRNLISSHTKFKILFRSSRSRLRLSPVLPVRLEWLPRYSRMPPWSGIQSIQAGLRLATKYTMCRQKLSTWVPSCWRQGKGYYSKIALLPLNYAWKLHFIENMNMNDLLNEKFKLYNLSKTMKHWSVKNHII